MFYIIPNELALIIAILGVVRWITNDSDKNIIRYTAFILLLIIIYFFSNRISNKQSIGFGDIKMLIAVGLWTENDRMNIFAFSCILAAVYAVFNIFILKNKKKIVPLAPFISISFILFTMEIWYNKV